MSLSSPGIGSGLDVNAIVDQLVALERRPITLLETAKTRLDTQLSSYGLMQSYLGNLQSIAAKLADPANWTRNTGSSSDDAVAVLAGDGAIAGTYEVEVQALASAQSMSSAVFADPSDLGTGTLTITRGGETFDIEIAAGETSLQAVRDKINAAGAGVSASIVQDASGPLLILTGTETGAANAFTVSVAGATGSLASLAYPGGMVERRVAADAQFTINGVPLSSAQNHLDNVIDGLSLTLTRLTTAPVQVTIAADKAAMMHGQPADPHQEWALLEPVISGTENMARDPSRGGRPQKAGNPKTGQTRIRLAKGLEISHETGKAGHAIRFHGGKVDARLIERAVAALRRELAED